MHSNTFLIKSDPQVLLKIKFAQNFDPQTLLKLSHKRYTKLLKISFTNITQNYSKLVSNLPKNVTQIGHSLLLLLLLSLLLLLLLLLLLQAHKRYSNWPTNVTQNYLKLVSNWSTNITQIDPQTLLKNNFKDVTKFKNLLAKTAQLKP